MARDRSGYVFQKDRKWYARVTFRDAIGKRRNVKRRANDNAAAKQLLKELVRRLDAEGENTIDAASRTFSDLANFYEQTYLHPAEYVQERKVSGLRAYSGASWALIPVHRGHPFRNHRGQRFRFIVGTHLGAT